MSKMRNTILMIGLMLLVMFGWNWLMNQIWPPKPPKPKAPIDVVEPEEPDATIKPYQESFAMLAGGTVSGVKPVSDFRRRGIPRVPPIQESAAMLAGGMVTPVKPVAYFVRIGKIEQPPPIAKIEPVVPNHELIAIGYGDKFSNLRVLLNTKGGSVQQIILTQFPESDREGLEVKVNGVPKPLHLVPGVRIRRAESIRGQRNVKIPEIKAGPYSAKDADEMSDPSYLMFHYEKPGDERPLDTLGEMRWDVNKAESVLDPDADEQKVVFQAKLGEPHNLLITKTFTLKRKEYHLGLKVDIKRLDGKKGPSEFRYQLVGANGLPIEGEWYTSTYRQAVVGFADDRNTASRYIEDARDIRNTEGSDRQVRTNKVAIRYAAVAVQYFASAIAVDDEQENRKFLEYVRATPVNPHPPLKAAIRGKEPKDWQYWDFLDDVTVRAITETFDPDRNVSHKYLLYNGPVKVRLLRQLRGEKAVDDQLVDRYLDKIRLDTLTDAPLNNALGRFANAIYWTDLVIATTNMIHSLLGVLDRVIPSLAICILIVTVMVRGMLFPLSRRQAANAQIMQAKMAKLQPELKKLQDKYKDDFQRMNQERLKLYKEHGVNPFAALGGCLPLLLQMPIFMGLYYALQESIFFRLESFLWIPNLAAPDMLIFWSESIPFLSQPNDLGSTLYLGPYFNILPVAAVCLMQYQQKKMMPKSDDPQVQAQQRMMKFMMIIMGVFFYKVAAGLCLYFIASTLWGLTERRLLPKPKAPGESDPNNSDPPSADVAMSKKNQKEEPAAPPGWFGRAKLHWKAKWKEVLEQAQKQQEHRRDPAQQQADQDQKARKKKKKRK